MHPKGIVVYPFCITGPPIVDDPGTLEVLKGQNVTLKCNVTARPPANMTWRYPVSEQRQLLVLIISFNFGKVTVASTLIMY